jgi:hypothetical protein
MVRFYVVFQDGGWSILFRGQRHGPHATRAAAIGAAVDAAQASGSNGLDAQVLVQQGESGFRPEWTYGADPYPVRRDVHLPL